MKEINNNTNSMVLSQETIDELEKFSQYETSDFIMKRKAEERYPVIKELLIPAHGDVPEVMVDINEDRRKVYMEGYTEARNRYFLSWEDIKTIVEIHNKVEYEARTLAYNEIPWAAPLNGVYKETLRRFNQQKNK